jgi:DNA transformation protein and related proteins
MTIDIPWTKCAWSMNDLKGDKLFVNLGASQTRRRLKGFGHGVRKVQTAGTNRAVIIHTATGQHLQELQAKFSDVGFSASESDAIASLKVLIEPDPAGDEDSSEAPSA